MRAEEELQNPDSATLNAVAAISPEWPYGEISVRSVVRIGAEYGLSGGAVYRVEANAADRHPVSFVVKRETAQAVERALCFHRSIGAGAVGAIPRCLGGRIERHLETGLLFLEDVSPAAQGDVLAGCTRSQAIEAVRALAHVHATPTAGVGTQVPLWKPRRLAHDQWQQRVAAATRRYPQLLTPRILELTRVLPGHVEDAIAALARDVPGWVHGDMHLDNVLFRAGGPAVLIDWSGVSIGPPAIDLMRLLTEGVDAGSDPELADDLVSGYLAERGRGLSANRLWDSLSDALALLLMVAIGWAAREEHQRPIIRMRALQENLLRSCCAWAANEQMALEGRLSS